MTEEIVIQVWEGDGKPLWKEADGRPSWKDGWSPAYDQDEEKKPPKVFVPQPGLMKVVSSDGAKGLKICGDLGSPIYLNGRPREIWSINHANNGAPLQVSVASHQKNVTFSFVFPNAYTVEIHGSIPFTGIAYLRES